MRRISTLALVSFLMLGATFPASADATDAADAYLKRLHEKTGVPGLVAAVSIDGKIV